MLNLLLSFRQEGGQVLLLRFTLCRKKAAEFSFHYIFYYIFWTCLFETDQREKTASVHSFKITFLTALTVWVTPTTKLFVPSLNCTCIAQFSPVMASVGHWGAAEASLRFKALSSVLNLQITCFLSFLFFLFTWSVLLLAVTFDEVFISVIITIRKQHESADERLMLWVDTGGSRVAAGDAMTSQKTWRALPAEDRLVWDGWRHVTSPGSRETSTRQHNWDRRRKTTTTKY